MPLHFVEQLLAQIVRFEQMTEAAHRRQAAYVWLDALGSFADALLYSVGSMTTRGAQVTLAPRWQMMGALEAVNGMLLFGISTAYIFAVLHRCWAMLSRRH
jgi:hypothetical protein